MFTTATVDDLTIEIPKVIVDESEFLSTLFDAEDEVFIPLSYAILKDTIDAHGTILSIGDEWERERSRSLDRLRSIAPAFFNTFECRPIFDIINIAKTAHYLCLDRLSSFALSYSAKKFIETNQCEVYPNTPHT